jgi:hypothetical protein
MPDLKTPSAPSGAGPEMVAVPTGVDTMALTSAVLAMVAEAGGKAKAKDKDQDPTPPGIEALADWREAPNEANRAVAVEVLSRCGTLVLDGHYYWLGTLTLRHAIDPRITLPHQARDYRAARDPAAPIGVMPVPRTPGPTGPDDFDE